MRFWVLEDIDDIEGRHVANRLHAKIGRSFVTVVG